MTENDRDFFVLLTAFAVGGLLVAKMEKKTPAADAAEGLGPVTSEEMGRYETLKNYLVSLERRENIFNPDARHASLYEHMRYLLPDGRDATVEVVQCAINYQESHRAPPAQAQSRVEICIYDGSQWVDTGQTMSQDMLGAGAFAVGGSQVDFATSYAWSALTSTKLDIVPLPDNFKGDHGFDKRATFGAASSSADDVININAACLPIESPIAISDCVGHELFHKRLQLRPSALAAADALTEKTQAAANALEKETSQAYEDHAARRGAGYFLGLLDTNEARAQAILTVSNMFKQREYILDDREMEVRLSRLHQTYTTMTGKPVNTPADAVRALNYFGADMDPSVIDEIAGEHPFEFGGKSVEVYPATPEERFKDFEENPVRERSDILELIEQINATKPSAEDPQEYWQAQRKAHKMLLERMIMKLPGIALSGPSGAMAVFGV